MTQTWLFVGIVSGLISVGVALAIYFWVVRQDPGSERARQVAKWISDGAASYLKRLYTVLAMVATVLAFVIAIVFSFNLSQLGSGSVDVAPIHGLTMAAAFIFGALCSAVAGYMGMTVAVKANVRSAVAVSDTLNKGFRVAFYAGSVMGLAMVGMAVIGMSVIFLITGNPEVVLGFSFGASTLALLAKAGGGIYTKTADIAADLVGKVEVGIPEDDPRNPAVVADNVGDNVGDVAGMGADIFDSYVASTVAAMLLGAAMVGPDTLKYTIFPLVLCTLGIFASLIGIQFVRVGKNGKPGAALNFGTIFTCVLFAAMVIVLVITGGYDMSVLWSTLVGLTTGVVIGFTTEFFTSDEYKPVQETARVSSSGAAITIITGFSYGLLSIIPSIIGIVIATLVSYYISDASGVISGVYGIGISAVGMLAVSGMIVSSDAYGPIVDNARGIAEMAGMDHEVIERADVSGFCRQYSQSHHQRFFHQRCGTDRVWRFSLLMPRSLKRAV